MPTFILDFGAEDFEYPAGLAKFPREPASLSGHQEGGHFFYNSGRLHSSSKRMMVSAGKRRRDLYWLSSGHIRAEGGGALEIK